MEAELCSALLFVFRASHELIDLTLADFVAWQDTKTLGVKGCVSLSAAPVARPGLKTGEIGNVGGSLRIPAIVISQSTPS